MWRAKHVAHQAERGIKRMITYVVSLIIGLLIR